MIGHGVPSPTLQTTLLTCSSLLIRRTDTEKRSNMSEQTPNKQQSGDVASKATEQPTKGQEGASKGDAKKSEKKKGFFAKWRDSTADAYDKHRASGGTL